MDAGAYAEGAAATHLEQPVVHLRGPHAVEVDRCAHAAFQLIRRLRLRQQRLTRATHAQTLSRSADARTTRKRVGPSTVCVFVRRTMLYMCMQKTLLLSMTGPGPAPLRDFSKRRGRVDCPLRTATASSRGHLAHRREVGTGSCGVMQVRALRPECMRNAGELLHHSDDRRRGQRADEHEAHEGTGTRAPPTRREWMAATGPPPPRGRAPWRQSRQRARTARASPAWTPWLPPAGTPAPPKTPPPTRWQPRSWPLLSLLSPSAHRRRPSAKRPQPPARMWL